MKKFSEYLITESLKTKADIKKAIEKFDELPEGKKASKAREILKAAEDVGYVVKKTEILAFKPNEEKDQPSIDTFKDLAKESKDLNDFINKVKKIKNVPYSVSVEFRKKYGNGGDDIESAAKSFFDEVRNNKGIEIKKYTYQR